MTGLSCFFALCLGTGLFAATLYHLFCVYAAWRFFCFWPFGDRKVRDQGLSDLPPVSLLKPLKGLEVGLYENLASFCCLDYPTYQIVFAVRDPQDPAIKVVEKLKEDFPQRDIILVVRSEVFGPNYKVSNLHHALAQAQYDLLVLSDSDVRVEPDYLHSVVVPLQEPEVGLVTCLYRARATGTWASLFEALFINTYLAPLFLVATQVEESNYAFGATIGVKRPCLEQIGGFLALKDYLADDYHLAHRIVRAGWRVRILPYMVEIRPSTPTFRAFFFTRSAGPGPIGFVALRGTWAPSLPREQPLPFWGFSFGVLHPGLGFFHG